MSMKQSMLSGLGRNNTAAMFYILWGNITSETTFIMAPQ